MNGRAAASLLALALLAAGCNRPQAPAPTPAAGVGSGAAAVLAGVPSGTVVAFVGAQAPAGWTLCDGRRTPAGQPTPDLRGRFIMGADTIAVDAGQSGGSATHTHAGTAGPGRGSRGTEEDDVFSVSTSGHSHPLAVDPADSLPPFLKLVYIMKD